MSHAPPERPVLPLALDLAIPRDDRFVETAAAVSGRVAEYLGYGREQADGVREAVQRTVSRAVVEAAAGEVAIACRAGDGRFEITVRYEGEPSATEARLASALGDRTIDAMRRAVDEVAFGRDGRAEFCRLACRLPDP